MGKNKSFNMKQAEIQKKQLNELVLWDKNPRAIKEVDYERLKNLIKELGLFKPFVINQDNIILGGNMRYRVCKDLGYKEVFVSVVKTNNEAEMFSYALADNDRAGYYEEDKVAELVLQNPTLKLDMYKLDLGQLTPVEDLLERFGPSLEEDEPPELEEGEAISKLGEVYQLGRHRVMCGDSTKIEDVEKLMNGQKADMVFTDPPYGMNLDTDWSGAKSKLQFYQEKGCKGSGNKYERVIGDNEDFNPELVATIFNNFDYCKEIFVWGADYYPELLKNYKLGNMFVWDKRSNDDTNIDYVEQSDKMFGSQFELCWSKNKHRKQIARVKWAGIFGTEKEFDKKRVHPSQKPTTLSSWFIDKYSKENDLIVDLFGGSGSTLIACEQLNRQCYMMELDEKYASVIIDRWEKFTGQVAKKIC